MSNLLVTTKKLERSNNNNKLTKTFWLPKFYFQFYQPLHWYHIISYHSWYIYIYYIYYWLILISRRVVPQYAVCSTTTHRPPKHSPLPTRTKKKKTPQSPHQEPFFFFYCISQKKSFFFFFTYDGIKSPCQVTMGYLRSCMPEAVLPTPYLLYYTILVVVSYSMSLSYRIYITNNLY